MDVVFFDMYFVWFCIDSILWVGCMFKVSIYIYEVWVKISFMNIMVILLVFVDLDWRICGFCF